MPPIQLLKRPKTAVSCSSCKERFNTTDLLATHLHRGRFGAVCTKTKALTLLSCIECERDFPDIEGLEKHFQDSFVHNEELSKPTGRSIYVGRLPYGVTERLLKDVLFSGYTIETTSMLTHCEALGKFTNFAIVNLSTTVEAERAVKLLNGTYFYGSKIAVRPQKPKTTKSGVSNDAQRSRVIVTVSPWKENMSQNLDYPGVKGKQPKNLVTNSTPVNLRGGAAQFQPTNAQQHVVESLQPHHDFNANHSYREYESAYNNASQKAPGGYGHLPYQLPNHAWPSVVSSGPHPHPQSWSTFPADQIMLVADALTNNCHTNRTLTAAGFNVTKPNKPPQAELQAKVNCKFCGQTRKHLNGNPCSQSRNQRHDFAGVSHIESRYTGFNYAPPSSGQTPKRFAICLDCEMAGAWNGDGFLDELIQLTAIDYLTGEILISTLVAPTLQIRQWRTRIHGVSPRAMNEAIASSAALNGCKQARALLFEFMDVNTILVGHALHNDLNVLKIAHSRCVDSEVLATLAVDANCKKWGLKALCESLPQLAVQRGASHDCLEDSFAAREAVLCMTLRPDILGPWASTQQARLAALEAERQFNRTEKEAARLVTNRDAEFVIW